ncbi:chemotaxis protein CheC [Halobacillus salinarum]|uniref:Chemotaxis protein CheC n=1 Tax=Halobacillus salinarum TaxID=2932257 RepID=A0ABY4EG40_9BACI|nr:chemotaxis protein CheC [Halobacillus salinarum]UOQ43033.1 chemotaxis protein CheC [Halobacillus salinarum]
MSFSEQFSTLHLDVLKEVGNIGAGHAATSLSNLLNRKIDMHIPAVNVVTFDEVMDLAGGAEEPVVSIALKISGDVPGDIFFILPPVEAERFVQQVTGLEQGSLDTIITEEFAVSALQELGNILSGSYISALSDFTNLDLYLSVPSLAMDMAGAILSYGLLELSHVSDQAIVIETALGEEDNQSEERIKGHFFLFPHPDSYRTLFKALGVADDD